MSMVSFVKLRKSIKSRLKQGILESLDLIDFIFETEIQNVVIKPNLCYYWDHTTGKTTHPKFIAELVDVLREKISNDISISIVESDASAMKCDNAFKVLGFEKLAANKNVELVNLSNDSYEKLETNCGGYSFHLKLPKTIKEAQLKINVTKVKYSFEKIKITCALKNIFGCNPDHKKFRYHPWIEETIVALNKIMGFNLNFADADIVSGIQPRRLGLLMASQDPVALDVAAAMIAGVNPKKVGYIKLAAKEGLGNTSFIQRGASWTYFKQRYPRKGVRARLVSKAYNAALSFGLGKRLGLD